MLGGGGLLASSWNTGLVTGMADAGVDVRDVDRMIGTSSGARVALQLASGIAFEEMFTRQLAAASGLARPAGGPDLSRVQDEVKRAKELGGDRTEILKRFGALAMSFDAPDRRALVAQQLPVTDWPERNVQIIALNAQTGLRRVFDRESGIPLVDAVIATTSAFGSGVVWFEGQPYFDGGYHSSDNADLAIGYERVLVLALIPPPWAMKLVSVEEGVAMLKASGAQVDLIQPDEEAMAAIAAAGNPMSPAIIEPAARAGRAQGQRVVARLGTTRW